MPRKAILVGQGLDGFVRLDVNGCRLRLRAADYYAGLAAGKAELRAERQAHREAAGQAQREADSLTWIDTDTGGPL